MHSDLKPTNLEATLVVGLPKASLEVLPHEVGASHPNQPHAQSEIMATACRLWRMKNGPATQHGHFQEKTPETEWGQINEDF